MTDDSTLNNAVSAMKTLNAAAAESMLVAGANACTDITGFGLIGHLQNMMNMSGTTASINLSAVPIFPGVRELIELGMIPGGTRANRNAADGQVDWDTAIHENDQLLLCDAQTSGGLMISIPEDRVQHLMDELAARNCSGFILGTVETQGHASIRVNS